MVGLGKPSDPGVAVWFIGRMIRLPPLADKAPGPERRPDPIGEGLPNKRFPSTAIIPHSCSEVGNASGLSGSGRSVNVPISNGAPRVRGKVQPSYLGQGRGSS